MWSTKTWTKVSKPARSGPGESAIALFGQKGSAESRTPGAWRRLVRRLLTDVVFGKGTGLWPPPGLAGKEREG